MTEVWVGIKDCGCLTVVSFDRDWIEEGYLIHKIHRMDLEEAREKLKPCECSHKTESKEAEA